MADSLRDRLKSLGVQVGIRSDASLAPIRKYPVHEILSGDALQNSFGATFCHTETYPHSYRHGNTFLDANAEIAILAKWAKTADLEMERSTSLVFLDTETTGLSGGTGTFVFLVGIGYQDSDGFTVKQFFLTDPAEEAPFLASLSEALSGFHGLVTFNGKSFDVPLLNTRYALNRLSTPFQGLSHIDLLPMARRLWKYRLANRNLSILETEILELKRSNEEIPGWMIPEMYIDYCRTGDARPLKGIFYHNAMDIVSLAALMFRISYMLVDDSHTDDIEGVDMMAIGKLYESLGQDSEAQFRYQDALQRPMTDAHLRLTRKSQAHLFKKQDDWKQSLLLFKELAEIGDWEACEELAKYFEHIEKDYVQARKFCEMGLAAARQTELPKIKLNSIVLGFEKRIQRLTLKEAKIVP